MSKAGEWFKDFFFPRRCPFCGTLVEEDLPCGRCQELLPWLTGKEAEWAADFLACGASALRYQGDVAQVIHRLKFKGKTGGVDTLGVLTGQCALDHFEGRFDLVTWVPLSPKSLRRRGFDQARLLAEGVARLVGMEAVSTLAKEEGRAQQSTLTDPAARRANVLGAFFVENPALVTGRRVLLVDDVTTTGSTSSECGRVLLQSGAAEVYAVTLAKAGEKKDNGPDPRLTEKEIEKRYMWFKYGI